MTAPKNKEASPEELGRLDYAKQMQRANAFQAMCRHLTRELGNTMDGWRDGLTLDEDEAAAIQETIERARQLNVAWGSPP